MSQQHLLSLSILMKQCKHKGTFAFEICTVDIKAGVLKQEFYDLVVVFQHCPM